MAIHSFVEYTEAMADYVDSKVSLDPKEITVDYSNIISIADAFPKAAKDVRLKVEAIQDLHGYNNPWVGGAGDNLLDIGESISDWFATDNNGTTIVDGDISTKVTATFTPSTGSIKVTNYNSTGYWWMSKVVKLKKNTDYKCYYGKTGGSSPILFGFSNLNVGTVGTQISPFYDTQSFNSGNYEYVVISIYPSNINVTQMQIKEASTSATFTPYENICPISGWNNAKVTRVAHQLWDEDWEVGSIGTDGSKVPTSAGRIRSKNLIPVKPNTSYYLSQKIAMYATYDINGDFVRYAGYEGGPTTLTTRNNEYFIMIGSISGYGSSYTNDLSVNYPVTFTSYERYKGATYTIDLNGTRYGGTLDVTSGVLTLTHEIVDLGDFTWAYHGGDGVPNTFSTTGLTTYKYDASVKAMCSAYDFDGVVMGVDRMNSKPLGAFCFFYEESQPNTRTLYIKNVEMTNNEFKTFVTGQKLVYELATPQTIQLTAEEVELLQGNNTLFGDTGDISLTYNPATYGNIVEEVGELEDDVATHSSQIQALTNYTADTGVKNQLNTKALLDISTSAGITYSLNADWSIDVQAGTTTAELIILSTYRSKGVAIPYKPNTKYIFSIGENKKQANLALQVLCKETSSSSWSTLGSGTNVDSVEFTMPATIYELWIRLDVASGKAVTATTLFPMVRDATITDPTYQPYAKTNVELTAESTREGVTVTPAENVTLNSNTHVYKRSGVVDGSLRLSITDGTAGQTICTLSEHPKDNQYTMAIATNDRSISLIIIGADGKVTLFGAYVPSSEIIIPVDFIV